MATLRQIKVRLRELGLENEYGYRAETKLIPDALEEGETLLHITSGIREGRRWYVLLTEGRILFLTKPTMGSPHLVAIDADGVRRVHGRKGLLFGSLGIETDEGSYSFSNVLKKSLNPFLETAARKYPS